MREEIIALGGEVRFESKVTDLLHRRRPDRRRDARQRRHAAQPPRRARARTQLARHVAHAGAATRASRGQAVRHRLSYRASAVTDRRGAPRAFCRSPELGAADYKLVHHAAQRALGLQLLHVPWRHGGCGHLRAGARGHQRHEPVLAQRAQCQRGHRGGDQSRAGFPRRPACGVALQEALESTAYFLGGSDYCAPGQLVGDFLRGVSSTQLGDVTPSYKPGVRLGDLSQALPAYAIDAIREALPAFGKQIRGFDRARCRAHRRRNPHLLTGAHHP